MAGWSLRLAETSGHLSGQARAHHVIALTYGLAAYGGRGAPGHSMPSLVRRMPSSSRLRTPSRSMIRWT
jgi:hypothetical protein